MRYKFICLVLLCVLASSSILGEKSYAAAGNRVALVVGNASYQFAQELINPLNDAKAVATTLRSLGFDVIHAVDLDHISFLESLNQFQDRLVGAETALLYYAGHGIQFDGINYLLPTDSHLIDSFALSDNAIPLHDILDLMEGYASTNILLLDACRNNPFVDQLSQNGENQRSRKGLSRLKANDADTLIMYATSPGSVAEDGELGNSPFADAFVRHAPTVGAEFSQVARRIIRDVRKQTNYRQNPEMVSAMASDFFLSGLADSSQTEQVASDFEKAKYVDTLNGWSDFLKKYPQGFFSTLAQERLNILRAEQSVFNPFADFAEAEKQLNLRELDLLAMSMTLSALGYEIDAQSAKLDGDFRTAVRGFQKEWGLMATGYIDFDTWAMVESETVQKAAGRLFDAADNLVGIAAEKALNLSKEEIRAIITGIGSLGYVPESSNYDRLHPVRSAISVIQYRRGLIYDGFLTAELAEELLVLGRRSYAGMAHHYKPTHLPKDFDPRLVDLIRGARGKLMKYDYFDGKLYAVTMFKGRWDDANWLAKSIGGHLAVISSNAEKQFITRLLEGDDRFFYLGPEHWNGPALGYDSERFNFNSRDKVTSVTGEPANKLQWNRNVYSVSNEPAYVVVGGSLRSRNQWKPGKVPDIKFFARPKSSHIFRGIIVEFPNNE